MALCHLHSKLNIKKDMVGHFDILVIYTQVSWSKKYEEEHIIWQRSHFANIFLEKSYEAQIFSSKSQLCGEITCYEKSLEEKKFCRRIYKETDSLGAVHVQGMK